MSLAYWSLKEIFDRFLLAYYLEEVCGLSCCVSNVQGEPVFTIGDAKKVPTPSDEDLKELSQSPLPIDIPGGRASGLFAKNDFLGYAVVSAESETDTMAADFVFQLLNYSTSQQMERDEVQFAADYLRNSMALMQRLSQKTSAVFNRKEVADLFIHECEQLFGVRAGAVLVNDPLHANPVVLSSFGKVFSEFNTVMQVCVSGKVYVNNTKTGDSLNELVVPLQSGTKIIGAIYLRNREIGPFSAEDQSMAQTLGAVLGASIANIQSHNDLVALERVKSNLGRYLSPNLLREIVETGQFQTLGGKRMRVSILFTDIRGFTKLSEKISPEDMVRQLNEYFEEMSQVIFKYDGTLDKYVGDLIMVLFGAPKPMADSAVRAVKTAIEMQKRIRILNAKWSNEKKVPFGVGMGINVGEVVFGNIGSSQAMGLTVIGDNVNQAQRLEAYAKPGEILITEAVYKDVQAAGIKVVKLGQIEVKGKQIDAYRVEY